MKYDLMKIATDLRARGEVNRWFGKGGRLTKKGEHDAIEYLSGYAAALIDQGDPMPPFVWIAYVRGAQDFLDEHGPVF